jgi:hypothetical protein
VFRDHPLNEDLCKPWKDFKARTGEKNDAVRRAIKAHVAQLFGKYRAMNQEYAKAQDAGKQMDRTRTERIQQVRNFYRNGPEEHIWKNVMTKDELDVYKASWCCQWKMGHWAIRATSAVTYVFRDYSLDKDLRKPWKHFEKHPGEKNNAVPQAIKTDDTRTFRRYRARNEEYAGKWAHYG